MSGWIDYTNHFCDTIVIDGLATWDDFCRHKPHRVKPVITASGQKVFVHKAKQRDRHRYWLWHCIICNRTGLVRADTLTLWAKHGHKCKCRRHKVYAITKAFKRCPDCGKSLPTTDTYWYIQKRGYLSHRCKRCQRAYSMRNYKYKLAGNDARRNTGGEFVGENKQNN